MVLVKLVTVLDEVEVAVTVSVNVVEVEKLEFVLVIEVVLTNWVTVFVPVALVNKTSV